MELHNKTRKSSDQQTRPEEDQLKKFLKIFDRDLPIDHLIDAL